jgi:hypothetical protein
MIVIVSTYVCIVKVCVHSGEDILIFLNSLFTCCIAHDIFISLFSCVFRAHLGHILEFFIAIIPSVSPMLIERYRV